MNTGSIVRIGALAAGGVAAGAGLAAIIDGGRDKARDKHDAAVGWAQKKLESPSLPDVERDALKAVVSSPKPASTFQVGAAVAGGAFGAGSVAALGAASLAGMGVLLLGWMDNGASAAPLWAASKNIFRGSAAVGAGLLAGAAIHHFIDRD